MFSCRQTTLKKFLYLTIIMSSWGLTSKTPIKKAKVSPPQSKTPIKKAEVSPSQSKTPIKKVQALPSQISWAFMHWKPYATYDKKTNIARGVLVNLVNAIIKKALPQIKITYKEFPWKRAQNSVKDGSSDFLVTVPTPERMIYCEKTEKPIFLLQNKVYFNSNNPKNATIQNWKTIEDIKKTPDIINKTIQGTTLYADGWWTKNLSIVKTQYVRDTQLVLTKLESMRADFAIVSELEFLLVKNKKPGKYNNITSGQTIESSPFHILISKQSIHTKNLNAINKAIAKLEASGSLEAIKASFVY